MKFILPLILGLLCAACRPVGVPPSAPAVVAVPTKGNDAVVVEQIDSQAAITVTSTSGIGGLALAWAPHQAPEAITLHLQLAGLEELSLLGGAVTVQASVSSIPPYPVRATLQSAPTAAPMPLAPGDAYWPAITIVPAAGARPSVPLPDGYFAVTVPGALIDAGAGRLDVSWIDFYR